jgi:hypothetical protein
VGRPARVKVHVHQPAPGPAPPFHPLSPSAFLTPDPRPPDPYPFGSCLSGERSYRGDPMVEPGLVTLAKIVGTLLLAMGVIPFLFLLSPGGDKSEPKDNFDDLV